MNNNFDGFDIEEEMTDEEWLKNLPELNKDNNEFIVEVEWEDITIYAALRELYQSSNGCFNRLGLKPDQPLVIFG